MKKIAGIIGLLVVICVLTALLNDRFLTAYNIENVIRRSALFGIISIGAGFVIITAGIDLSIGSLVCLSGVFLPFLLTQFGFSVPAALATIGLGSLLLGGLHGLLITRLRLQPFVVTLCGLLLYRGLARGLTGDQTQGFGNDFIGLRALATGKVGIPFVENFAIPAPCIILIVVGVAAAIFLNRTIYGRYLLALGGNEEAARYSGINTDRMTVIAYIICSGLAGLGGTLFVLDVNSAQPVDFGNFYELYAIAAAVLGGCSLRGGEGAVLGIVVGAAVMQVLRNSVTLLGVPTQLEFAIIGGVILVGVVTDEVLKRFARKQRRVKDSH